MLRRNNPISWRKKITKKPRRLKRKLERPLPELKSLNKNNSSKKLLRTEINWVRLSLKKRISMARMEESLMLLSRLFFICSKMLAKSMVSKKNHSIKNSCSTIHLVILKVILSQVWLCYNLSEKVWNTDFKNSMKILKIQSWMALMTKRERNLIGKSEN